MYAVIYLFQVYPHTVVFHLDYDIFLYPVCAYDDMAHAVFHVKAVRDAVFDQRLDDVLQNPQFHYVFRREYFPLKFIAIAELH